MNYSIRINTNNIQVCNTTNNYNGIYNITITQNTWSNITCSNITYSNTNIFYNRILSNNETALSNIPYQYNTTCCVDKTEIYRGGGF